MFDLATQLAGWYAAGTPFALATVTAVRGSAPRDPGAALAVHPDGTVLGNVSGGCVEAAVYELARRCLDTGEPVTETFGYAEADAFAVGLSCGGELDVLVRRVNPGDAALGSVLADDDPVALCTVTAGPADLLGTAIAVRAATGPDDSRTAVSCAPGAVGSTGSAGLDAAIVADAAALLAAGRGGVLRYGPAGECDGDGVAVLVQCRVIPPRLLVFGAIDLAAQLCRLGRDLGYRVTVCDARSTFLTPHRFPDADELVVDWPHRYLAGTDTDERTVICVLTHDAKFDVPLLVAALRGPAGYVGALGTRRTDAQRRRSLVAAGLRPDELTRLRAPIGLDLGARGTAETALAIAAEIVAVRTGHGARPLSTLCGPIHGSAARPPNRSRQIA
jgi:xanthine dehydrogenase accessory factor